MRYGGQVVSPVSARPRRPSGLLRRAGTRNAAFAAHKISRKQGMECCQCANVTSANVANCQLELDLDLGNGNIGYWQHLIKWLAGQRTEDLGLRIILESSGVRPSSSTFPTRFSTVYFQTISLFVRFRVRRRPLFVSGGMAKPEGWRRRPCAGRRSQGRARGRRQQIAERRFAMPPGSWSRVAQRLFSPD